MRIRAEELMVRDWILKNDEPYQITSCSDLEYFYDFDTNIETICITPEILIENNFKKQSESSSIYMIKNKDTWISYDLDKKLFHYNGWNKITETICNIWYVHELQHALNICHTKKEIKL